MTATQEERKTATKVILTYERFLLLFAIETPIFKLLHALAVCSATG